MKTMTGVFLLFLVASMLMEGRSGLTFEHYQLFWMVGKTIFFQLLKMTILVPMLIKNVLRLNLLMVRRRIIFGSLFMEETALAIWTVLPYEYPTVTMIIVSATPHSGSWLSSSGFLLTSSPWLPVVFSVDSSTNAAEFCSKCCLWKLINKEYD